MPPRLDIKEPSTSYIKPASLHWKIQQKNDMSYPTSFQYCSSIEGWFDWMGRGIIKGFVDEKVGILLERGFGGFIVFF
jgi:hypothetical protein